MRVCAPHKRILTTVHYSWLRLHCMSRHSCKMSRSPTFCRRAQAGAHAALYELPVRQAPICLFHPCWYTAPQPKGSTWRGCRRLPLSSTCSERPVKRHDMLAGILLEPHRCSMIPRLPAPCAAERHALWLQLQPCADCMPSRPSRAAMTTVPSSRSNASGASRACMSHTPHRVQQLRRPQPSEALYFQTRGVAGTSSVKANAPKASALQQGRIKAWGNKSMRRMAAALPGCAPRRHTLGACAPPCKAISLLALIMAYPACTYTLTAAPHEACRFVVLGNPADNLHA